VIDGFQERKGEYGSMSGSAGGGGEMEIDGMGEDMIKR